MAWASYGVSGFPLSGCDTVRLACDPGVVLYRGAVLDTNDQGLKKVSRTEGSQWSTVWESGLGYLLE